MTSGQFCTLAMFLFYANAKRCIAAQVRDASPITLANTIAQVFDVEEERQEERLIDITWSSKIKLTNSSRTVHEDDQK